MNDQLPYDQPTVERFAEVMADLQRENDRLKATIFDLKSTSQNLLDAMERQQTTGDFTNGYWTHKLYLLKSALTRAGGGE